MRERPAVLSSVILTGTTWATLVKLAEELPEGKREKEEAVACDIPSTLPFNVAPPRQSTVTSTT